MGYYNSLYKRKKKLNPAKIAKNAASLKKTNPNVQPIIISGNKIAKSWWGISWNKNLESYADYENRISRGRSYVRSGAVLDLQITNGEVNAIVQGTRVKPYNVRIAIAPLAKEKWDKIANDCGRRISNLEELVSGKFPQELMDLFTTKAGGLFPSPKEISFSCSCPDWAYMCKHVAAVLYGIGTRVDQEPLLFFTLRNIPFDDLIKKSIDDKIDSMLKNADSPSKRTMTDVDTKKLFGV